MADAKVEEALRQIKKKLDSKSKPKKERGDDLSQFNMLSKINDAIEEANALYEELGDEALNYYEKSVSKTDMVIRGMRDLSVSTSSISKEVGTNVHMGLENMGMIMSNHHENLMNEMFNIVEKLNELNIATSFAGDTFEKNNDVLEEAVALLPPPKPDIPAEATQMQTFDEFKAGLQDSFKKVFDDAEARKKDEKFLDLTKEGFKELFGNAYTEILNLFSEPQKDTVEQLEKLNKTQDELATESASEKSRLNLDKLRVEPKTKELGEAGEIFQGIKKDFGLVKIAAAGASIVGIFDAIGKTAEIVGKEESQVTSLEHAFAAMSSGLSSVANMIGIQTNPAEVYAKVFGEKGWMNQMLSFFEAPPWPELMKGLDTGMTKFFMGLFEFVLETVPKFVTETLPQAIKNPVKSLASAVGGWFGMDSPDEIAEKKAQNNMEIARAGELLEGKASPLQPAKMAMMGDGFTVTKRAENEMKKVQVPMAPVINNISTSNTTTKEEAKRNITDLDITLMTLGR